MERRWVKASKPYFPLEGKGCEIFLYWRGGFEQGGFEDGGGGVERKWKEG